MAAIASVLTGNSGGVNYKPTPITVTSPISQDQVNQLYGQTQTGLNQQQALLTALAQQHGLQNQSNVYNQLSNVAAGQGPNPALAQLANTTGQNVQQQAAMMAGQRGAGQNVGLMARQAAQAGGNIQQQATGQAAALQAQQQMNALSQMGGMANQQAQQQLNAQNAYNQALLANQAQGIGAITNQNQQAIAQQNAINQMNAQQAAGQQQMQGQVIGGLMQGAGALAGTMFGGPAGGMAGAAAGQALAPMAGQVLGSSTRGMTMQNEAEGGLIKTKYAEGGDVPTPDVNPVQQIQSGPQSMFGRFLANPQASFAKGGKVPAMVSPGEVYLKPNEVQQVAQGANPMHVGEKIPGQPKVDDNKNRYENDTVPKTLDEGGIVLPRSVTQSNDPDTKARQFVANILNKKGR